MAQLVLDLPDEVLQRLRAEAERQHTTVEALVMSQLTVGPPKRHDPDSTLSAAALFGAGGNGPGTLGSAEAVDRYLRELRDEWE